MKHIMLVGSSGYVGGRILTALRNLDGSKLSTLSRDKQRSQFDFLLRSGTEQIHGDVRDRDFLRAFGHVDCVINVAGSVIKNQDSRAVSELVFANSMLPAMLASGFSDSETHLIFTGTYSHKSDAKDYEPQTFYAASKKAGEDFLAYFASKDALALTLFHTYDIYGPNQPHGRLMSTMIDKIILGEGFPMTLGKQQFAPVFVDDVVDAIVKRATKPRSELATVAEFDIYGPETLEVCELPEVIASALDLNLFPNQFPKTVEYSGREIMNFRPCHPLPELDRNWTKIAEGTRMIRNFYA